MDPFSHLLWTYLLFHQFEWWWIAALLGFLADAVVFLPAIKGIKRNNHGHVTIKGAFARNWTALDKVTHSLPVVGLVSLLLFPFVGFWPPLLGWVVHILMDIPTHSKEFFPTQFLWPFSTFSVNGFNWSRPCCLAGELYGITLLFFLFIVA
jgi:hypothetical protein